MRTYAANALTDAAYALTSRRRCDLLARRMLTDAAHALTDEAYALTYAASGVPQKQLTYAAHALTYAALTLAVTYAQTES